MEYTEIDGTGQPGTADPLLWGWKKVVQATGIPQRTLFKLIADGAFPKPIKRVGRRPYLKPSDVIEWAHESPSNARGR
jgi:predicted DNA-binding transcriptional regulator AlpA